MLLALPQDLLVAVAKRLPTFRDIAPLARVCVRLRDVVREARSGYLPRVADDGTVSEPEAGFFLTVAPDAARTLQRVLDRCPEGGTVLLEPGAFVWPGRRMLVMNKRVHLFGRNEARCDMARHISVVEGSDGSTLDGIHLRAPDIVLNILPEVQRVRIQSCTLVSVANIAVFAWTGSTPHMTRCRISIENGPDLEHVHVVSFLSRGGPMPPLLAAATLTHCTIFGSVTVDPEAACDITDNVIHTSKSNAIFGDGGGVRCRNRHVRE